MVKNQKQKLSPIPKSMEATGIPAIQLERLLKEEDSKKYYSGS